MSVRNILDGTIKIEGGIDPESTLKVNKVVCPYIEVTGLDKEGEVYTPYIDTPELRLHGILVLYPEGLNIQEKVAVIYSDGSTGTPETTVTSKVSNINSEQHVLTCQTTLKSLSKAIKQVIIPTGLDFTGRHTESHNTTAALINGTDLLLGMVHIYVENSQLMARVVFSETPSYTSMNIKINIVFN